jgi:AcrR family transcriptional regulator
MALGRPREFDTQKALDRALDVFWRQGYEGASLSDLTDAMQITRPSLYAAFGNKSALFNKVLERYLCVKFAAFGEALKEETSRRGVERILSMYVELGASADAPRGCLLVQGALACGEEAAPAREELSRRRLEKEDALRARIDEWKAAGDLPADASSAELASYVMTVANGMSVQASGGACRDQLAAIAETAMRAWPAPPAPADAEKRAVEAA